MREFIIFLCYLGFLAISMFVTWCIGFICTDTITEIDKVRASFIVAWFLSSLALAGFAVGLMIQSGYL